MPSLADASRLGLQLPFDEGGHALDRIEIRGDELLVRDRDRVFGLDEGDELQDARRVDDAALEERVAVAELSIALPEQEVVDDELAYLVLHGGHI